MHSEDGAAAARCTHNAGQWTPARWVAMPQCQPTNPDSRCGHF